MLTVFGLIPRRSAICWLFSPLPSASKTCSSRSPSEFSSASGEVSFQFPSVACRNVTGENAVNGRHDAGDGCVFHQITAYTGFQQARDINREDKCGYSNFSSACSRLFAGITHLLPFLASAGKRSGIKLDRAEDTSRCPSIAGTVGPRRPVVVLK